MRITRIFYIDIYRYFSKNIDNIDIYRHCVFTIETKRESKTFPNTMKSYKSNTATDKVIDQNYYNYEQYERSRRIEAFRSPVSFRLLFVKKYLQEVVWKMNIQGVIKK